MNTFPSQFSNEQILDVLAQAKTATAIHTTDEMIIETANDAMIVIWGKDRSVIGKPIEVALPELKGQPFLGLLQNVLHTGVTLTGSDTRADLMVNGTLQPFYFDFEYRALKNDKGSVTCILHTAIDVTERYLSRQRELELESELQTINEELAAANEELATQNEEMASTNEELAAINEELAATIEELGESQQKLVEARDTLKQAIDSAKLGTWSANALTDEFTISDQGRRLHNISEHEKFTLTESLKLVSPNHIDKIRAAVRGAISTHESFDVEYLVNPIDDSKPKWLRSTGKAYYNDKNEVVSVAGTVIDITESKERDQQKDDFISIASHELKTPVTSLKAALQLMDRVKNGASPEMLNRLIDQCNRSMDKISTLIEDLLNLSRMNEGHLQLEKSDFNIADMITLCCSHVRVTGKHDLILQGDKTLKIYADEHRIDQVVINMVNNAVKYAPNSKQIYLNIEKQEDFVKISVKDAGPGVPKDKQEHLFERYYRTDTSGYQNSGLGLGLYISAEIVRKHGGEIGIDSEPGMGSTFWFTLPL